MLYNTDDNAKGYGVWFCPIDKKDAVAIKFKEGDLLKHAKEQLSKNNKKPNEDACQESD